MTNFHSKKYLTIILSILALVIFFPTTSFAQKAGDICTAEKTKKETDCKPYVPTATDKPVDIEEKNLEARQKCDVASLALDQCNLKAIREKDSLPNDEQEAAKSCISTYTPTANSTQTGTAAGLYVPVHETGQLLTLTQSTNSLTSGINEYVGKSYNMDVQICLYLHAIKRVQYAMEDLTFVKEPDMRRIAAAKIEEYKKGLLGKKGLVQTGGSTLGELTENPAEGGNTNGEPLYVKNLSKQTSDSREGAAGVVYDALKQSNNSFKVEVAAKLKADESSLARKAYNSTVKREDYDAFISGGKDSTGKELTADKWWDTFTNIFDPSRPNNPYNAYLLTKNKLEVAQNRAEDLALREYSAGNGFLPTTKCIAYTPDGKYCTDREVITPGIIISRMAGDALATKLEQYLDPALGKIEEGNQPVTSETETFSPSLGPRQVSGGSLDTDRDGNIDPIDDDDDGDGILDIIDDDDDGDGIPDNEEEGGPIPAPVISLQVNDKLNSTREIVWDTRNVSSCKTGNDWFGTTDVSNNLVSIIKTKGESLSIGATTNSISFPLPLKFIASWSKNGEAYNQIGMSSTTNVAKTGIIYTWNVPKPQNSGDIFYLNLRDGIKEEGFTIGIGGVNFPIDPKTESQLVKMFKNYEINNGNMATVYANYKFTYDSNANTPNIKIERVYKDDEVKRPEPRYKISCIGRDGSTITDSASPN